MAQINITLNQEEILQLLKNNSQETFKLLLEKVKSKFVCKIVIR